MTASGTPADTWDTSDTFGPNAETGGGVELFPVNFTAYRHHPDLDTDRHVKAIADLLAPFGPHVRPWTVPGHERNRQAVEDRLGTWKRPAASHYGNSVLYWAGHGSADHLAHHRTPAPIDDGIFPEEVAHAIGGRQLHPDAAHTWVIVVLDACFSHEFAQDVHLALLRRHRAAKRYLLLSTAAQGYAELGAFTHALQRALTVAFRGRKAVGLVELGQELARDLGGYSGTSADDHRDRLVRLDEDIASAVSAPFDQLDELRSFIDQLPPDERRHFVPKASGAEFGELAWYFHGRTVQRDHILRWLTTIHQGTLVVTGPAGAGKSALLGHVLLHTSSLLRDLLVRHEHLDALPPGTPCPDDPFDLTAHLAGLTLNRTVQLIADAAGLPDLAQEAAEGGPAADLTGRLITELRARRARLTLLFDALDEAEQPLIIADTLLRPLAAVPGIRLVVGTRRSTREGPDRPAPADTDLLDALQPRPHPLGCSRVAGLEVVEVGQDQEALAGYLRTKLTAAKHRGTLDADDTDITAAVHRLVVDHPRGDGEPQQFLYVRLAAHELLNDPRLLHDPTPLIGRTHRELFTRALERLHRTNPRYTPLLQALGLAQGRGLPDQDGIWAAIANALAPLPTETRNAIPGLLRDAAPYLALDQEHDQSVYRLAHRTFTEHFTAAPDAARAHAAVTTALIHHATSALGPSNTHDGDGPHVAPAAVSPYIRHHLAAHARLGHSAGALDALGENPDVLDTLDLTSITTAVFGHGLPTGALPPAIAGTVLLQHDARSTIPDEPTATATAWRRWSRRLGTTYIQGTPPPSEPALQGPGTRLPDLVTGSVRRRRLHLQLTGHPGWVSAIAVFAAPDGTPRLATGGVDRSVRIWDPATGSQTGEPLTGHTNVVNAVAVFAAPDGTPRLATGGVDGTVRIWDPATGSQAGEPLTGHTREFDISHIRGVRAVAVFAAPDGTARLATGGGGGSVRIWDPATGTQIGEPLTGYIGYLRALAVFTEPDGTPRIASGGYDGSVQIWDPAAGTQIGEPLTGHEESVLAIAVFAAPDGTPRLATGGGDGTVRIWDPATGSQIGEPLIGHPGWVYAVAVFTAPDGTPRVASATGRTVWIWDPATGTRIGEPFTGHTGNVGAMAVFTAPDGTPRLATGSDDKTVRIWDPAAQTRIGESPTGHSGRVYAVVVFAAPDGTARLATGGVDGSVRIWDPVTGTQIGEPFTGHTGHVLAVAVFAAPDGTPRLASGGNDGSVRIWDPATGTQIGKPVTGHGRAVYEVAVFAAPDGTPRIASANNESLVGIWDPSTGTETGALIFGHEGAVSAVAVFAALDGTPRLATGGVDRTVRIWFPSSGTQTIEPLTGHTGRVNAVAVFTAPDGTPRLATGSDDRTVRIWDPTTGTQIGEPLVGHTDRVNAVAVFAAPDGTPRLASAGHDGTVRIWGPATGTGTALPLASVIYSLTAGHGLLIAGTEDGFLCLDISSMYDHPADAESEEAQRGARDEP
ncbi:hypothetical protein ACFP3U_00725 [Kitasatospora misakiensis]|uniref:Orc1-like AAA ATPase domain-containing protein n=1 Tax=Kitasatospora misakiensis TaxID=67330 RepID=A0ABW0WTA4_9ACTN